MTKGFMASPNTIQKQALLADSQLVFVLLGLCVKKLGGSVSVTQDELDSVAGMRMEETFDPQSWSLLIQVKERKLQS